MKYYSIKILLILSATVLLFPILTSAVPGVDPIVTPQWLADQLDSPGLVILDVRMATSYKAGHIQGSVHSPAFPNFFVNMPGAVKPWMEVTPGEKLIRNIGSAGISTSSTVVIVGRAADSKSAGPGEWGITQAARVAVTLIYAGVENVALLDGGYEGWVAAGKPVSTEPEQTVPKKFRGTLDLDFFVRKEYVESRIGKTVLLDSRNADSYFGIETDMSTTRGGHIPSSRLLPAPWFWNTGTKGKEITWKDKKVMLEMIHAVLGMDKDREIIVYCGVGGYASPVSFLLIRLAGYTNVKFYDGSMQEWTADPEATVIKYTTE